MIAKKDSLEPHSSAQLPNSKKVYLGGTIHQGVRVPMREIALSPTKGFDGKSEVNASVRVYDCSGPWGDPDYVGDVAEGLPALRAEWIRARADVEEYSGRETKPMDDGYLSEKHAEYASQSERNRLVEFPGLKRKPLRAAKGHPVSQLWYARHGIVTPEMEFIAIRENQGLDLLREKTASAESRSSLAHEHPGTEGRSDAPGIFRRFPQRIPKCITPEFVRDEVAS
ncbi:MAG TPA: hypothetical protein VMZ27_16695, partial [Candidatus Saccharimonadales bacterium]|nr:hypothetical protein [Candidatus Saccharimonadales bacterium]